MKILRPCAKTVNEKWGIGDCERIKTAMKKKNKKRKGQTKDDMRKIS